MSHIKIVAPGWEGYTGSLGMIEFVNGISTDHVPLRFVDRISASVQIVECDKDGIELDGKELGPAARMVAGAAIPAEIVERVEKVKEAPELRHATEDELNAERIRVALESGKMLADKLYSEAELQKIADEKGIAGLREIAGKWNVKERSIPRLVNVILAAQRKFVTQLEARDAERAAQLRAEELAKAKKAGVDISKLEKSPAPLAVLMQGGDRTPNAIGPNGESIYVDPKAPKPTIAAKVPAGTVVTVEKGVVSESPAEAS